MKILPTFSAVGLFAISSLLPAIVGATKPVPTLSEKSQGILRAYEALKANPDDAKIQQGYLASLPRSAGEFECIFDPQDFGELYSRAEEILEPLGQLLRVAPETTGEYLFRLASNPLGTVDAWWRIREFSTELSMNHTATFVRVADKAKPEDVTAFARFICDFEGIASDDAIPKIISELQKSNRTDLAKTFDDARTESIRSQQNHAH